MTSKTNLFENLSDSQPICTIWDFCQLVFRS